MKYFHIPRSIARRNHYKPYVSYYHFLRISKQRFQQIENNDEISVALAEHKMLISLTDAQMKRYSNLLLITELPNQATPETIIHHSSSCNLHILSPFYSAVNKFLGTGVILLGLGAPTAVAIPVAAIGAACNFWVQYHFITKSAAGSATLDKKGDDHDVVTLTWRDEVTAGINIISSITEGAGFAVSVYLQADANELSLPYKIALASLAFKMRQGTTMQADGQKIFIEEGKDFSATTVGMIANLTQQFPPVYPVAIDFNSWVRDFLPTLEGLLPAMAFNAFLQSRIESKLVCALLSTLVSSGEWYQQRGYSVNIIKHIQEFSEARPPLGFAHAVDILIRAYNESVGNIVNGRIINDIVGIMIPPALWNLIIKMAGNFFTGYIGGQQVIALLPAITDKLGVTLPDNVDAIETIVKPIVGTVCAMAGISQYIAGYDKNLAGLSIGIKPLLVKVYGEGSVTNWGLSEIRNRFYGWSHYMGEWPHRFFSVGRQAIAELKEYPCFKHNNDDGQEYDSMSSVGSSDSLDAMENGLSRALL